MEVFLLLALMFVFAHATSIEEQWQAFKIVHGKTYKSEKEEKRRFAIFPGKLRQIEEHNEKFVKGKVTYTKGINQFTDLTMEEFKAYLSPIQPKTIREFVTIFNDTSLDLKGDSINWVSKGVVTPVKNQGHCGSCWAFSTVGAIEGQVAKVGGPLESLSAQNLVDCAQNSRTDGCNGGDTVEAFEYDKENGVLSEAEYPYIGCDGSCSKRGGQKISGYAKIAQNESALLSALIAIGPISVGIDATFLSYYASGIYDRDCADLINHAVLAVGAATENGKDYWLIKNSWGTSWGDGGYFKLVRDKHACGIDLYNSYPIL